MYRVAVLKPLSLLSKMYWLMLSLQAGRHSGITASQLGRLVIFSIILRFMAVRARLA
jgi:hypothetical protein